MDAQAVLKQRWATVQQAAEAKAFGIIIGLKPGQLHVDAALQMKATLEKKGKTSLLLAINEVTPETLLEFPSIDAYVNTACPRISLEAPAKFSKPVLTVNEFMVVVGEVPWENLLRKGLFEN
jgi:2-(3-amino-3-carboxypropyl)histidine synthase